MAYCAASDVIALGNFKTTDSVPIIAALIPRADAIIDKYTGRDFDASSDSVTRYYDFDESVVGDTLFLDEDFVSITSVTSGHSGTTDNSASAWSASDYFTLPKNDNPKYAVVVRANSPKDWSTQSSNGDTEYTIAVAGVAGYSTSAPADIVQASVRLTYWMYKQRESDADLDRPLLTADGVTIMPSRLPADVVEILNRYKRERMA